MTNLQQNCERKTITVNKETLALADKLYSHYGLRSLSAIVRMLILFEARNLGLAQKTV